MNRLFTTTLFSFLVISCYAQTAFVQFGSTWKYLDDGSDQGTAWYGTNFNDASWSAGNAQLGFGDNDENTVVNSGHLTYYFRQEFTVANPSLYNSAEIDLIYDDGAVVYINGIEVDRVNMGSGVITYQSPASSNSGDDASHINNVTNNLVTGTNVIAVEVHNRSTGSSDISFDLKLSGSSTVSNPANLERGPYLQLGTPTSMRVKWRTSNLTSSKVIYGTDSTNLNLSVVDSSNKSDHELELTNLLPYTKYFYAIGSLSDTIFGYLDYSNYFYTSRTTGDKSPIRMWVLGDAGTANSNQRNVRDAYYNYANGDYTNLVLQLGDNAYSDGKDSEYQDAMFENMYEDILRQTVFWSTIGNHDEHSVNLNSQTGPYFDIYSFPKNAEAGGVASGTEEYYSFDYGNVHFIVLSSENGDLTPNGTMMTWMNNDINNTTQDWIIAYWHHPPYSKGSHDSDVSSRETKMRENALPILEAAGIDLVLNGHSHSYERSYLINGHYGQSSTYNTSQHELDGTSGEHSIDCSYLKTSTGPDAGKGAVYAVAGSSGKTSGGSLNHAVMYMGVSDLGSVVIDVEDNRMDVRFL
ncbi:MAG: metallophosphoesterase family protein, partial [Flavobacteriales bacterium]|nr:metallophosphoesterase family protein [Flavobacteriales bacterium]